MCDGASEEEALALPKVEVRIRVSIMVPQEVWV